MLVRALGQMGPSACALAEVHTCSLEGPGSMQIPKPSATRTCWVRGRGVNAVVASLVWNQSLNQPFLSLSPELRTSYGVGPGWPYW